MLAIQQKSLGNSHADTAKTAARLIDNYEALGRADEATKWRKMLEEEALRARK
jgi:hypothetical protein